MPHTHTPRTDAHTHRGTRCRVVRVPTSHRALVLQMNVGDAYRKTPETSSTPKRSSSTATQTPPHEPANQSPPFSPVGTPCSLALSRVPRLLLAARASQLATTSTTRAHACSSSAKDRRLRSYAASTILPPSLFRSSPTRTLNPSLRLTRLVRACLRVAPPNPAAMYQYYGYQPYPYYNLGPEQYQFGPYPPPAAVYPGYPVIYDQPPMYSFPWPVPGEPMAPPAVRSRHSHHHHHSSHFILCYYCIVIVVVSPLFLRRVIFVFWCRVLCSWF